MDHTSDSSSTPTFRVLHVTGKLVDLTFRPRAEDIELVVDRVPATIVNRARLSHWLVAGAGNRPAIGGRPFVDIPLTLRRDDIGVWIEVRGYVAPTLLERDKISKLINFINQ